MTATAALVVLVAACIGIGRLTLRALRLWGDLPQLERIALSFAIGLGVIGWLFFWLGMAGQFNPTAAWVLCSLSALGLIGWGKRKTVRGSVPLSSIDLLLIALFAVAFLGDFIEALAPPVDADSLAYHFELPRQFVEAGHLFFVPRAFDGAAPLLVQMTYTAARLLGGELAMTLWTFISGWAASLLLFAIARRWLNVTWSLALALLFQTLPAMVYGAGAGQVEARLALFVLVAVVGLIETRLHGRLAAAVLVGLGAGFYAGSKYTGLIFIAATGLALLSVGGPWLRRGLVCGVTVLIVGGQWYGWNAWHTGDPVFPTLFTALHLPDGPYWDASYAADVKAYLAERYNQVTWWQRWLAFPIVATFFPPYAMEAGRVGMGPFFVMIAPLGMVGLWRRRHRLWAHPLGPVAVMTVLFYFLWLRFGGIPKVRHLLPFVPVVLLGLGVAAASVNRGTIGRPIILAFALSLTLNLAAQAIFVRPFFQFLTSGMDRTTFLQTQLSDYAPIPWLNKRDDVGRVLLLHRWLLYDLRHPAALALPYVQKQVETRPGKISPRTFLEQIRSAGVTHLLLMSQPADPPGTPMTIYSAVQTLARDGCLIKLKTFDAVRRVSRSVPTLDSSAVRIDIWGINDDACRS